MQGLWLLVIGAGAWQLPTISKAKELGYRVVCTDGASVRPGFDMADAYEVVDIVDNESTLAVARKYQVSGVICDTTDIGCRPWPT